MVDLIRLNKNNMENTFENALSYIHHLDEIDGSWSESEKTLASAFMSYAAIVNKENNSISCDDLKNIYYKLPIGTVVTINNDEESWGDQAGKKFTITGHVKWLDGITGYELDDEGIYLNEDFENIDYLPVTPNSNTTLNRCECEEPKEEPIKICLNCNGCIE